MNLGPIAALLASTLVALPAMAQETVDIGVLRDSDIHVVQNQLYTKAERTDFNVSLGWMPFDPLVTTPNLQLGVSHHFTETLALSARLGGGYGLKTARYAELEGPAYGVAPYAFRYLGSALVGVEWSPIYGKFSGNGRAVVHYDLYGAARLGATVEQSVIPDGGIAVAPTLQLGIGARFHVSQDLFIRFEVNDALMAEHRKLTDSWHFKQNGGVELGVGMLFPARGGRDRGGSARGGR